MITMDSPVTPASLRELAARADQLAADMEAAQAGLRSAGDEPTRRVGYRLDDGAGRARQAAASLHETAADLARLRARSATTCPAEWGVCPEHGNTLRGTGGRSWCVHPGCGRTWDYDRDGQACTEPAAFEVRGIGDTPDGWGRLCAGHTLTARESIDGIQVRAIGPR